MTWHTLLQHEFLDKNLGNLTGPPARLRTSSPPPVVSITAASGTSVLPGKWFGTDFNQSIDDIIGIEIDLRFHAPANTGVVALCSVGSAMSISLLWDTPSRSETVNGELRAFGTLRVFVGGSTLLVPNVSLPHRRAVPLRVRWHNSGQCRVELEEQLLAYDPAMAPAQTFSVSSVRLGDPGAQPALRPRHVVHYVHVRAIRELDSAIQILEELAADLPGMPDSERCSISAQRHFAEILTIIRDFMRAFTAQETRAWNFSTGGTAGPFSQAAVDAHAVSTAAFVSAMEFLTRGGDARRTSYLTGIGRFFQILHDAMPQAYAQMLQDLESVRPPSQACLDAAAAWTARHQTEMAPIIALADDTLQIAKDTLS